MTRRKTHEEFIQEIYELVGGEYTVLGQYKDAKSSLKMRHNTCGYEYEIGAGRFIEGRRCKECNKKEKSKKIRKSHSQFVKEVYELVQDEYTVLSEYETNTTPIIMKHNMCGNEYETKGAIFLRGKRCPKCMLKQRAEKRTKTHDEFVEEVVSRFGDKYTILGQYVHSDKSILVKHNECGHEWSAIPYNLTLKTNPTGCPKCSGNIKKTHEEFVNEVFELEQDKYSVLGEYKNTNTHITMKHNECGYEYSVTPAKFIVGKRCPKCSQSKGESAICNFLSKMGISFDIGFTFDDCKDKACLPFDVVVFDDNGDLSFLCEFDGIQHYEPIEYFGGEEHLKGVQRRDKIKTDYCKANNIPLLRIPYWELDNVEKILEQHLSHLIKTTQ